VRWVINGWFKRDSYVSSKDELFVKIEKIKPNVVVMDLGLYEKMNGIETTICCVQNFKQKCMIY